MAGWMDGFLPLRTCQGRIRAVLNTLGEEQHFVPCSAGAEVQKDTANGSIQP